MELELRILSGLHRGALLPLSFGSRLTVGSDASCDIVLVDPGVKGVELSVELSAEGWKIERFDSKGKPTGSKVLPWGQAESAGCVVLTVVETSAPWAFVSIEELNQKQSASADKPRPTANDKQSNIESTGQGAAAKPKSKRKLTQRLAISAAVIFGFATLSISRAVSPPEERSDSKSVSQAVEFGSSALDAKKSEQKLAKFNLPPKGSADSLDAAQANKNATRTGEVETNPAKQRAMLMQRLRDSYLEEKLEINLTDREWSFHGSLDEEETERFNRIVSGFIKEHNVKISLKADVNSTGEMLPFSIQQFNGGALASVVTDDGQRLYIGDAHMGYVLERIEGRRIIFAGKRKVEVIW